MAVYHLIGAAIDRAAAGRDVLVRSVFSDVWVTTVSGLDDAQEMHFKLLVSEYCSVKKI
ncbi:hypothetical protein [Burkholderia ambifaria]|uniref:hypothetical protein n=1 Tax=Burkholderia ambifaria TaxID=152480 RepID=UPI002FE113F9